MGASPINLTNQTGIFTSDNFSTVTLGKKIVEYDCSAATRCDLSISLDDTRPATPFDFTLTSDTAIPDINTVIIGEAVSPINQSYYQRIIQIEQTKQ